MAIAKKKPVVAAIGKAVVNWEEQMAKFADAAVETEKNTGSTRPTLNTRGGVFSYQGEELGEVIEVIVVHHILENKLYEGRYDPDNPESPVCYALSPVEEGMAPHEEVENPVHATCKGCPNNEYGSSDTGRGKACKNTRRLAVIMSGDAEDPESIAAAQVAYLNIPVTSVGNWATYVKGLSKNLRRPPFGVVTEITLVPDPKNQFMASFKVASQVEAPEIFEALIAKRSSVEEEIMYTYPKPSEMEERAPKPSKARAKGPVRRR